MQDEKIEILFEKNVEYVNIKIDIDDHLFKRLVNVGREMIMDDEESLVSYAIEKAIKEHFGKDSKEREQDG